MNQKYTQKTLLAVAIMMNIVFLFCGCTDGGNRAGAWGGSPPPNFVKPVPENARLSQTEIENLGALTSFKYNCGSFHGGAYEFAIININEKADKADTVPIYRFIAEGLNGVDMYANSEVGENVLDDIKAIIVSEDIFAWDGFNKRNKDILDGYGFEFIAAFENGSIEANGYEHYPENHSQGHQTLTAYLEALADSFAE